MLATRSPIVVVALLAWLAVPGSAGAHGTTPCVGSGHACFKTLHAAVDAAHHGSTIRIAPGTYRGGVVVARSVRLAASGAGRTVIRGGGPVLTLGGAITVSDVTITGGVTSTNPHSPGCGPDVPVCGPGYAEATVQGAGITNAGALALDDSTIHDNHGTASGLSGVAQGGGIWNGEIFGIPTAPPTHRHAHVTGNVLRAAPGLDVQGGGLYTVGFPPVLTDSQIADNLPDQCVGC